MTGLFSSKEEIQKMGKMFDHMDKSRDGQISIDEIERCMKEHQGDLTRILECDPDWHSIIKTLDTNNDVMLDYHEFLQAASNRVELLNEKNLVKAFNTLDMNGDGKIDADELKWTFACGSFRSKSDG
jgi:Ca2+-binding EF-hand superfamily protein